MTESENEHTDNEHVEDVESQSGDETGAGVIPIDQNRQQPPPPPPPPQAQVAVGRTKRPKRTRKTRGIPPNDLMTLLLAFNNDSTQGQIEQGCKETIKDAVKWQFFEIKK